MTGPAVQRALPHCCGKRCDDGAWRVLLIVPVDSAVTVHRVIDADHAEHLGRQLLEYSALVRDRIGLPGSVAGVRKA
ncbi:MAG: hypothetical protein ACK4IS_13270 [Erythrobacter sp.]